VVLNPLACTRTFLWNTAGLLPQHATANKRIVSKKQIVAICRRSNVRRIVGIATGQMLEGSSAY
jgi:hypothetical protein